MVCLIIAAGKQSRFKSTTPKALCKISSYGKTLVEHNIELLSDICPTFVVANCCNYEKFEEVLDDDLVIDIGASGLGSGDAVYEALKFFGDEKVIICWGDTVITEDHIRCLNECCNINKDLVIPVRKENKPYVHIDSTGAYFSKYGDNIPDIGNHDLSMFVANTEALNTYCEKFIDTYYNEMKYNHIHGSEFEFLDLLNEKEHIDYCLVECDVNDYSFNTVEDFNNLKFKID